MHSYAPAERPLRALVEARIPVHTVRGVPGLVIGEIAGRDSVAALVAAVREGRGIRSILPTIVATGTEYGGGDEPDHASRILRERVASDGVRVFDPLRLTSPELWRALNGRWAAELIARYGAEAWSTCSACHLYVHLARVPLAWALGVDTIVTGERDAHRGRLKFSQLPATIEASREALRYAGIDLLEPIQALDDDAAIDELVGRRWEASTGHLDCVHSGNFIRVDGSIVYDEPAHRRYLDEFFLPAARSIIDAWRAAGVGVRDDAELPDYLAISRDALQETRT